MLIVEESIAGTKILYDDILIGWVCLTLNQKWIILSRSNEKLPELHNSKAEAIDAIDNAIHLLLAKIKDHAKDNPCHIVNMALKGKDKMKSIEDRIKQILSEHLGVKEGFIQPHHNIKDDLGADSLDYVEIVMYLEDEFDMEIPDEEAEKFDTVQSVIDYVHTNT